jgi:hypothetical protein
MPSKIAFQDARALVKVVVYIDQRVLRVVDEKEVKRLMNLARFKALKNTGFYLNEELLKKLGDAKLKEMK